MVSWTSSLVEAFTCNQQTGCSGAAERRSIICPPIIAAIGAGISYLGAAVTTAGAAIAAAGTAGTIAGAVTSVVGGVVSAIGAGIGIVGGAITAIGVYAGSALGMEAATTAAAANTTGALASTFGVMGETAAGGFAVAAEGTAAVGGVTTVAAPTAGAVALGPAAPTLTQTGGAILAKSGLAAGKVGTAFKAVSAATSVYSMFASQEDPVNQGAFDPLTTLNRDASRQEHLDKYLSPGGIRPSWASKLYRTSGGDLTTRMGNLEDQEKRAEELAKEPVKNETAETVGLQLKGKEAKK